MATENNSQLPATNSNCQLIKVSIIDDHKVVADGIEEIVNKSDIAEMMSKAHSVKNGREMLKSVQPDVLLLDISMPDGNGIELCAEIKKQYPQIKILMLTSYSELAAITHALDAGADGYVLKNSMSEEILEGIRITAKGGRFLCDQVSSLMQKFEKRSPEFTRRELLVLRYIKDGLTSTEIAVKLGLGFETVRSYRKTLYFKLQAHSTRELINKALDLGLL